MPPRAPQWSVRACYWRRIGELANWLSNEASPPTRLRITGFSNENERLASRGADS